VNPRDFRYCYVAGTDGDVKTAQGKVMLHVSYRGRTLCDQPSQRVYVSTMPSNIDERLCLPCREMKERAIYRSESGNVYDDPDSPLLA
jgi:hypothetical protein